MDGNGTEWERGRHPHPILIPDFSGSGIEPEKAGSGK